MSRLESCKGDKTGKRKEENTKITLVRKGVEMLSLEQNLYDCNMQMCRVRI
jgi:hypothetical protein